MQEEISQEDSLVVTYLKQAGAICLVKGNMPQAGLSTLSDNHIWG